MSEALPNLNQTSALIRHRRSIKPVDMDPARPVGRALLMELLENANWAPTHGLTEPWRFRVFEGDSRTHLGAALQSIYRDVTPAHEFREDKFAKLAANPTLAPTVIACSMARCGEPKIPELEEIEAVACALQNVMLSAAAAGLGSFWSSLPLLESTAFQSWLRIGEKDRCLGLLYLGWPKPGAGWPRSARQPIEKKVSWA